MDEKIKNKIEEIKKEYGKVNLNLGCYRDIKNIIYDKNDSLFASYSS